VGKVKKTRRWRRSLISLLFKWAARSPQFLGFTNKQTGKRKLKKDSSDHWSQSQQKKRKGGRTVAQERHTWKGDKEEGGRKTFLLPWYFVAH
jgi:hypothetical protein